MGRTRAAIPREEPDFQLASRDGSVAYRYVLEVGERKDVGEILKLLDNMSVPFRYLLLVPGKKGSGILAYLGLGSYEVNDLPFRLAAAGIRIRRGETLFPDR